MDPEVTEESEFLGVNENSDVEMFAFLSFAVTVRVSNMTARHQGPLETDWTLTSCLGRCSHTVPRTPFFESIVGVCWVLLSTHECVWQLSQAIETKKLEEKCISIQMFFFSLRCLKSYQEINTCLQAKVIS